MDEMSLTVVILTRNRADLLPMSLSHLELQGYPAARFEVVIADMGSTDNTPAVLERYAAGAPVRTRCLRCEQDDLANARNRAVEGAAGKWILFLDDDLLAGPGLVENHVRQQEFAGGCATVGRIAHHPQIDPQAFTRWYEFATAREFVPDQALRSLDWRACNLSLPRRDILEAGGFDEEPSLAGFEDIELAWRLEQKGLRGFYHEKARAFLWRPTTIRWEQRRYYDEGYALNALLRKTGSDMVRQRYEPRLLAWRRWADAVLGRASDPLNPLLTPTSLPFALFWRRALRRAFRQGYRDGRTGRPRRTTE